MVMQVLISFPFRYNARYTIATNRDFTKLNAAGLLLNGLSHRRQLWSGEEALGEGEERCGPSLSIPGVCWVFGSQRIRPTNEIQCISFSFIFKTPHIEKMWKFGSVTYEKYWTHGNISL